jgi:hypothetical protein
VIDNSVVKNVSYPRPCHIRGLVISAAMFKLVKMNSQINCFIFYINVLVTFFSCVLIYTYAYTKDSTMKT